MQDNDARLAALQELSSIPLQDIHKLYLEMLDDNVPKEVGSALGSLVDSTQFVCCHYLRVCGMIH